MDKATEPEMASQTAFAREALEAEAAAIQRVPLTEDFDRAVALILARTGRDSVNNAAEDASASVTQPGPSGHLVVSGLGKSGQIGQKLSATFASTGTPSHFLHPTEALHGDLGRIRAGDVVLLLSYGGGTEEVVTLATLLRQDGVPVIAVTAGAACELGRAASLVLPIGDVTEACPLRLAPTASTTAMLALGDALALSVSRARNFGVDDFKRVHPGGELGRQLMPVTEAMRFKAGQNLPVIDQTLTAKQAYAEAERYASHSGIRRAGALLIVDAAGALAGIVTDGDLRTALIRQGPSVWTGPVSAVMTAGPSTLTDQALVRDAVQIVRARRFDEIPVVDQASRPVGLIDVQDLAALKVIEG
jgi:arabinose-5-phosphate isomerase